MQIKSYNFTELNDFFTVSHIVEVSYRGIPSGSIVDTHILKDFWCFYYIDRGNVCFKMKNGEIFEVESGNGIFFAPKNNFIISRTGDKDSNVFSLFFVCNDLPKEFYDERIANFDTFERSILTDFVNIGHMYFERYSNLPGGVKGVTLKKNAPAYISQLVKILTELLLIRIYKDKKERKSLDKVALGQTDLVVNTAIKYMYDHIGDKLTIADIADAVKMSESNFRAIFKKNKGQSVMNYFNLLKIEQAKIMIRKRIYTYSEISELLGYSSENYFARTFKKLTGMTPSEYARLIYAG